jgi:prolyl oligopeptidase
MPELQFPAARRLDIAEEISGRVVRDPYRWLEDADSAGTRAWLAAQDALFAAQAAAAERLIRDGWTTRHQLAISGGSNGGLLVGAAITQRPELFAAVLCSAPLLDMVRYEQFGLGETWNDEFGTAADPGQLGWLLGYSPYHHVRDGTAYPAVLFTVFDSDTRVDPMHARKMCAALQHAAAAGPGSLDGPQGPARPILLRRESSAGHGARAVSRSVALAADTLAFAAFHAGHREFRR